LVASLAVPRAAAAADDVVVAPAPLAPIEPSYPEGAHGEAEVVLELTVAEDGSVARVTHRTGPEPFAEVAQRYVERVVFSPATRNGIPIRAKIAVRILFHEPAAVPSSPPSPAAPHAAVAPPQEQREHPQDAATGETAEVHVLGEQRAELGSIHISKEEARRVPGAFGDPFRVAEALPGVAPVLSGLPYYYVRGAPPGSVGYHIDGIRVPILFHVGPGPSVITPLLIERVDLFPGAYPARYGRYAGAIFAGETVDPRNDDRSRAEGQARIFDASAAVSHPWGDGRGSVLVGGRYSYTQAILAAVAPDYQLGYGDYQARVSYALTPEDRVSVLAFGGYDLLRNRPRDITLFDVAFHRVDLRYDHLIPGGSLRIAGTFAHDSVRTAPEDESAVGTLMKTNGGRLRAELEEDLGDRSRLRAGADFGAEYVMGDREQSNEGLRTFPDRTDVTGGAYADVIWRASRAVEIVPGMRFDQQRSRGKDYTFLEPRLGTRTRLWRGGAYIAGVGVAHQLPALSTRMPGRPPTALEQSEQEAVQTSQGIEYSLPSGMLGRTTLFYQHVDVNQPGVFGRSFGLEQFLRRDFTRKLGGFFSYTLSRAEAQIGRELVLSSFDRPHILSAVLGYDFGSGWRFGVRAYYASGRAERVTCPTPSCGPGDPKAPRPFVQDLRLPAFGRLDIRLEKRWTLASGAWVTGTFEWFNTLLATEIQQVFYTANGLFYDRQTALTLPSIGVEAGW
jgi:hypothetical protein